LDAPGALHHVMARGIERRNIFVDNVDREALLQRMARLVDVGALEILAWVLMPNHLHLLARTGSMPLSRSMRKLMTGHAVAFNRRHDRVGHLFQNRYRSILCEEEPYFLELVRYIHLNPLRGGIVRTLDELDLYPYSGHATLVGTSVRPWQSSAAVLSRFGEALGQARRRYRSFVGRAVEVGSRPDLVGGGLIRSVGGWFAVKELRRGREQYESDERILGTSTFVETVRAQMLPKLRRSIGSDDDCLARIIASACRAEGMDRVTWSPRSRTATSCRIRARIAFAWIHGLGRSGKTLARLLGVHPANLYRAAERWRGNAT